MAPDGSDRSMVVLCEGREDEDALCASGRVEWSPDGSSILFFNAAVRGGGYARSITRLELGGAASTVVEVDAPGCCLAWSSPVGGG